MACFVPLSASVMTPSFHWVGLGWVGLGQPVNGLGWIGSHKMDHGQLWYKRFADMMKKMMDLAVEAGRIAL